MIVGLAVVGAALSGRVGASYPTRRGTVADARVIELILGQSRRITAWTAAS